MTASSTAAPRRTPRRGNGLRLLFLTPALVLFVAVMIVPIATNSLYAFTNWNGFSPTFDFIGLDNFARLLDDRGTRTAFVNTVVFTAINAPLQILVGLMLAIALRIPSRFVVFLRVVVVIPIAVSGVVLGFIGTIIFDPSTGLLPSLGDLPALEFLGRNWLGDPQLAMSAVIAMNLWQWSGFTMLIFLAALAGIPDELYEAAKLDGASPWQQFRYITWPQLAPATTVNIVLTIIGGFKVFDIIYVLTGGGPGDATRSVVMQVVTQGGFTTYGYSATISVTLTVLILIVALAALALLRRRERGLS